MGPSRTDSMSSHESILKLDRTAWVGGQQVPKVTSKSQNIDPWNLDDEQPPLKPKKQSSQIAKELSDMIVYVQVYLWCY